MTQCELLQVQLQIAITHDHGNWTKRNNADYPGYWLFIIEEQLSKADRAGILSELHVTKQTATMCKRQFVDRIACLLSEVQP